MRCDLKATQFAGTFQAYFEGTIEKLLASGKTIYVMGDFNINLLHCCLGNFAQDFLLFDY
jgi:exonuclease III